MASFFRTVCRAASTIVISGMLCAGGLPQTRPNRRSEVKHNPAKKLHLTGVSNFGEVTPFLYRGAQPSREGFEGLAKMGIDIVVDARLSGKGAEKKTVNAAGMQYISIPWHCMFPKDNKMAQFLAVMRENPKKKVFVHCRYGDDRTGMMIAAYRMAAENWTAQEAWAEMQQFGMNRRICFPLISYERQFPEHLKKNPGLQGTVAEP
jgi:protein tyrosine phosphatase (PTP) superfamily phosphohydrolase (DUF442 family)